MTISKKYRSIAIRIVIFTSILFVLSACDIAITSGPGGLVYSGSPNGELCAPQCSINTADANGDGFYAIADPGYEFNHWQGANIFCLDKESSVCAISNFVIPDAEDIETEELSLQAIFVASTESLDRVNFLVFNSSSALTAGILTNQTGAIIFYVNSLREIESVIIIDSTGHQTPIEINNTRGPIPMANRIAMQTQFKSTFAAQGDIHTRLIEEAIDQVISFIQGNLDNVSPAAKKVAEDLKKALDEEKINPESLKDRVNRFVTDKVVDCLLDPISCINDFLEAIANDTDRIIEEDTLEEGRLLEKGDIEVIGADEIATPIQSLLGFSVNPADGKAPLDVTVRLNDSTPINLNGTGLQHLWHYEGGNLDTPLTLFGSGFNAMLLLTEPGTYTITLTVRQGSGGTLGKASKTVTVQERDKEPPTFTAIASGTDIPRTYVLEADDPSGEIISYAWTSDNGLSASGKSASMTFTSAGNYLITLTATFSNGTSVQVSNNISIIPQAKACSGGNADQIVQDVFNEIAGAYSQNDDPYAEGIGLESGITLDGGRYGGKVDVSYDGISNLETYTATVDALNRSVTLSNGYTVIFPCTQSEYWAIFIKEYDTPITHTKYSANFLSNGVRHVVEKVDGLYNTNFYFLKQNGNNSYTLTGNVSKL